MPARSAALGLLAICLGFLMITLDATIVNVALGPITAQLGGRLAAAQWIVSGYTLGFASLLLTAGALADRVGARTGFLIGAALFGVASATCSAAGSLSMLVGSRVLQGLGAAWLMPCSLALIAHTFPAGPERRRALAVWGGVSGVGLAAGPVLGGVLTRAVGWRAIFLVNLPIAAVASWLLVRHVEETARRRRPLDLPGQGLAIASLSLLTGGFVLAGLTAGFVAAVLLALDPAGAPAWILVASSVPLGATALAMPALTAVALGSAPLSRLGLASGLLNAARQTGGAFGVAVLGALLAGRAGAVSLRLPAAVIAVAYAAGVGLALTGRRYRADGGRGADRVDRPAAPAVVSA